MNTKEDVLEKTIKEYFASAEDEYNKSRYNSSVVLYFKSLVALIDLAILRATGKTPSSHNQRFDITKNKLKNLYEILDKDFPFYQDSYNIIISKEITEVVKEDAINIAKELKIKLL